MEGSQRNLLFLNYSKLKSSRHSWWRYQQEYPWLNIVRCPGHSYSLIVGLLPNETALPFCHDLKLYLASLSLIIYSHINLQGDINLFHRTSTVAHGVSFSIGKCVCINYCRNFLNAPVPFPCFIADQHVKDIASHKNLGVGVDVSLKFTCM